VPAEVAEAEAEMAEAEMAEMAEAAEVAEVAEAVVVVAEAVRIRSGCAASSVSSVEVVSLVRPPTETMSYSRVVGPERSPASGGTGNSNSKPELNDFGTFRSGRTGHALGSRHPTRG
jgi:hypothetical protein